jgi:hypothetical protein
MKWPDNVAERRRKLASYEVAGVSKQIDLSRKGQWNYPKFSSVLSGRDDLRTIFQPLRSWLISGAPLEQKRAAARIVSRLTQLAAGIGF